MLLPLVEEGLILALETLELTVDTVFETLVGLTAEQAQRATAWSGFLTFVGLLGWAGYAMRKRYLMMESRAPIWWAEKKQGMRREWQEMSWKEKLVYSGAVVLILGMLVLVL